MFAELPPGEETGLETFAFMGKGHNLGTTTTIQGGNNRSRSRIGRNIDGESMVHLHGLDQIGVKGEVTIVRSEAIQPEHSRRENDTATSAVSANTSRTWETPSVKSFDSR